MIGVRRMLVKFSPCLLRNAAAIVASTSVNRRSLSAAPQSSHDTLQPQDQESPELQAARAALLVVNNFSELAKVQPLELADGSRYYIKQARSAKAARVEVNVNRQLPTGFAPLLYGALELG